MATPITYESQLPALIQTLLGSKETTTQSSTANVDPLQQVFQQAMTASGAGVPEMSALIEAIFREGAAKVPELTGAYANATGSRSSKNSGLQLALGDLNKNLSTQALSAMLTNQTNNRNTATQAASSIAGATKSTSTTAAKGAKTNPLIPVIGGWALNKFGKSDLFDKLGNKISGAADNWFGGSSGTDPSAAAYGGMSSLDMSQGGAAAGDPYGSGTYDFSFSDLGGAGSFDFGGADAIDFGDGGFDWGSFNDIPGGIDFSSGFEDVGGFLGDFDWGTGADWGNLDLGSFLADGGSTTPGLRNKNYMGDAAKVNPSVMAVRSPPVQAVNRQQQPQPVRRPTRTDTLAGVDIGSDTGGIGVTDASNTNGVVGTPSQNNAAVMGMISLGLAPALGVPSMAISQGLNAIGVPTMSMSPMAQTINAIAQALGLSSASAGGVGSDGVSPGSVAAATGIDGMNSGGLGGMGVTMGLDSDSTGPVGLSADGSGGGGAGDDGGAGANAASGEGIGVFADGGMVTGGSSTRLDDVPVTSKQPGGKTLHYDEGEYVIPADVVRFWGTRTLDRMKAVMHTPVNRGARR